MPTECEGQDLDLSPSPFASSPASSLPGFWSSNSLPASLQRFGWDGHPLLPQSPASPTPLGPWHHEKGLPTPERLHSGQKNTVSGEKGAQGRVRHTWTDKLDHVQAALKDVSCTPGEWMYHFFRVVDDKGEAVGRSPSHRDSVSWLMSGGGKYSVADLLEQILQDPCRRPPGQHNEAELMYSPTVAWNTIRYAHPAVTSLAVQYSTERMVAERNHAVKVPGVSMGPRRVVQDEGGRRSPGMLASTL